MDKPPKESAFRDKQEPAFQHPPQWIHESVAARFFAPLTRRREARRRAVLELVNRLSVTRPSSRAPAARRSRS